MGSEDKVNILLVDDQPAKLLSYEVILAQLGENLIKAGSPQEALGLLLKTDFAVVLIDVVMPGLDGFELAAMIREHPRFQKLAIIFVSAIQVADVDHLRGYEIGAVDYVSVPVVPQVLRAKVRVFTELYRKTRQLEMLNQELEQRVMARTAELEASTERLRQAEGSRSLALSAGDMGSWDLDVETGRYIWDEGQHRIFGVEPGGFVPTQESIQALVHPDDRGEVPLAPPHQDLATRYQHEFRVIRPNGEVRWCFGAVAPTHDATGALQRLSGVTVDITERKRAEERQALLAREVDHRAKNTLAVVLSVLRLTRAKTTEDFVNVVEGRIHALAATHNLLSATRWEGANLRQIVDEEMAAYQSSHRQRIETDGPSVMLLPATAQAVALALHELATNAAKYGALSTDTGSLRLVWRIEEEALTIDWDETGGPPTQLPSKLGFGLTIVRSSIESQFRGEVAYDWRPQGLHCSLSIPRAQIVAPPQVEGIEAPAAAPQSRPAVDVLTGKRIMVVEDEFLISMMVKQMLSDLGAIVVGPYNSLAKGLAAAERESIDGAVLDFNLAGEAADPLASVLGARSVPFLFITGYERDSIDRRYANVPVLQKPIEADSLQRVLVSLLGALKSTVAA